MESIYQFRENRTTTQFNNFWNKFIQQGEVFLQNTAIVSYKAVLGSLKTIENKSNLAYFNYPIIYAV